MNSLQINKTFNNNILEYFNNTSKWKVLNFGKPCSILLNAGLPNLPLLMKKADFHSKVEKQKLIYNTVKDFPKLLQNPLLIFHSKVKKGDYVVFINRKVNDKLLMISITPNYKHEIIKIFNNINKITSLHSRNANQLSTWAKEGYLIYADKKIKDFSILDFGFNCRQFEKPFNYIANIINKNGFVKFNAINGINTPKYYRARIAVIKTLQSYYKNRLEQNISESDKKYFEKGIRLLRNGFIPEQENEEILIKNRLENNNFSNTPLTFTEITGYSTWFAMHPEKKAGVETATTSLTFPIKIKGNKKDIITVLNNALNTKNNIKLLQLRAKALTLKLELLELDNLDGVGSDFNKALKQFFANSFRERFFNLGKPKKILLKCGLPEKEIILTKEDLTQKEKKHKLTFSLLKNLPSKINNPILVFKSIDEPDKSILAFYNQTNHQGILQAVIRKNTTLYTLQLTDINYIKTIHGRNLKQIEMYLELDMLLYGDKEKFEKLLIHSGFNCPQSKKVLELLKTKLQKNIQKSNKK